MAATSSLGATASVSSSEAQAFYTAFTKRIEEARAQIDAATSSADLAAPKASLTELRTDLTEETAYLPRYDQQKHEDSLRQVYQLLRDKSAALVPRKTFAFNRPARLANPPANSKPKLSSSEATKDIGASSSTSAATTAAAKQALQATRLQSIEKRKGQHVTWKDTTDPVASTEATGIELDELESCVVDLRSAPSGSAETREESNNAARRTLLSGHLRRLRRCILLLGKIEGSILIDGCSDCTVVLSCRQFRMHDSHGMTIVIATDSIATLEKCRDISFVACTAEQTDSLTNVPAALPQPTLRVQDFDHISQRIPSPHWKMISAEESQGVFAKLARAAAEVDDEKIEELMTAMAVKE